jgi:hypothetical protein
MNSIEELDPENIGVTLEISWITCPGAEIYVVEAYRLPSWIFSLPVWSYSIPIYSNGKLGPKSR